MVLHNDVELENGSLARLVETLDSDPNYSLAVPKLLQWADSRFLDGVGDAILLSGGAYRVGHGELDLGQYETPSSYLALARRWPYIAALCLMTLAVSIRIFRLPRRCGCLLARSAPRPPLHFCAEGPRQTPRQRHPGNYVSSSDRSAHHSQPGSYDSQELSSVSSFSPGAAVICFSGSLAGAAIWNRAFVPLRRGLL